MSVATRELPASAIRVSAHCRHCKKDVETDGSNRCPDCGAETLPESRGVRRIVALNAVIGDAPLPETGGASDPTLKRIGAEQRQPVLIRASKEASVWHAARVKLLAALECKEAAILARYEAARVELQQIRRERSAISQDIGLIAIDAATTGPPTATPMARANPAVTRALLKGRWSRNHDACVMHGGTDVAHKAKGLCGRCYDKADRFQKGQKTDGD